jgi:hypothetical protein
VGTGQTTPHVKDFMLNRRRLAILMLAICPLAIAACQPSPEEETARRQAERLVTSVANPAKCTTGRLGDTTCTPTKDQVEAVMDLTIPASATNLVTTYESFQDWIMTANFTIPEADAQLYLSNTDFPQLQLDGPPVQAKQSPDGTYRSVQLVRDAQGVRVTLTAFTT